MQNKSFLSRDGVAADAKNDSDDTFTFSRSEFAAIWRPKAELLFPNFLSNSVVLFFRRTRQIPSALCAANAVHFFLLGRFKTLSQVIFPAVFASVLARNFKYKRTQARARAQNIFRRPRPRHFFRRSRERNYKRANDAPNAVKAFSLNSVWPDLPTFRLFGNVLLILVKWFRAYSMFGKFSSLLWQNFNVFGPPFNVVQGQILKYNLAIWSHWLNQRTLTIGGGGWRITVRLDSSLTRQELTKKNKCYFLFVVKLVNLNL